MSLAYYSGGHDFCELNHEYTSWVVEFHNTWSCLLMVSAGASTLIQSSHLRRKCRQCFRGNQAQEAQIFDKSWTIFWLVFDTICWLFLIVGLGSMNFHGTLSRLGQITDELNMILSALGFNLCIRLAASKTNAWEEFQRLKMGFMFLNVAGTALYFSCDFSLFIVFYCCCIVALCATMYFAVLQDDFAILRGTGDGSRTRSSDTKTKELAKSAWNLAIAAPTLYIGGFLFLWLPTEVLFCSLLNQHLPVFQRFNHALFHLTSSVGPAAFLQMVLIVFLGRFQKTLKVQVQVGGSLWWRDFYLGVIPLVSLSQS